MVQTRQAGASVFAILPASGASLGLLRLSERAPRQRMGLEDLSCLVISQTPSGDHPELAKAGNRPAAGWQPALQPGSCRFFGCRFGDPRGDNFHLGDAIPLHLLHGKRAVALDEQVARRRDVAQLK